MQAVGKTPVVQSARFVRLLWIAVLFLALIGVAVAVRRIIVLALGSGGGPTASLDSGFARHRALTLVHIIPGLLFMVLGPLQFVRRIRTRHPPVHRWIGRIFVPLALIVGVSALLMSFETTIGGATETAATTLFALIFLFSLTRAFLLARQRRFMTHREWMIRAFAIGLAVATIRPIVGIFFATSRLTHLTPHDFFGIAFWIGFSVQFLAAEAWIRFTRPQAERRSNAQAKSTRDRRACS